MLLDYEQIRKETHLNQAYNILSKFDPELLQSREEKLAFFY